MKKINELRIDSSKLIDKSNLVFLKGGEEGGGPCTSPKKQFQCTCVNSIGSWIGCYVDKAAAEARGDANCESHVATCFSNVPT